MAKALPIIAVSPGGSLSENAPLILHTRLEEMYHFAPLALHPDNVAELHEMRIAAKRLRYTMEIFSAAFASEAAAKDFEALYDKVKSVQEQIGDIHDADVRIPVLQDFLHKHAAHRPEIRSGLETLIAAQHQERQAGYAAFQKYWAKLQAQGFKRRFLQMLALLTPPPTEETVPAHG